MKIRWQKFRAIVSWCASHLRPKREAPVEMREEEIFFYDCGSGFYYFPYQGKTFFAAVRQFRRSHPEREPVLANEKLDYLGMGPGFMLVCSNVKQVTKELV